MNLDLWYLFYEVAKNKNISKASEKLHISQPAITKQIKKLESIYDCKLFIRNQKGVILTPEGNLIFNDIEQALNSFFKATQKIKDEQDLLIGTIRIGISTTLAKNFLMPYIKKFHKAYPNVNFEISTDPTSKLKEELKKGNLDFIINKFPLIITDDLGYYKLGSLEDVFVVSKDYKELITNKINLKDLVKYPILMQKQPSSSRDYIEKFCIENKVNLHSVIDAASSNLLIEFAKIGYGVGVVTREYVIKELNQKELYEVNVNPKIPKRDFGIIYLKQNYLSKCCETFLGMVEKDNNQK